MPTGNGNAPRTTLLLENGARAWPDVCAIRDSDTELSYAQLLDVVHETARGLLAIGAREGEPIVVPMGSSVEGLTTMLGVWRAGCCAVPLEVNSPAPVVEQILERAKSRIVTRPAALPVPETWERVPGAELAVSGSPPRCDPILSEAALVVFTSGSTGRPKAAVLGHRGLFQKLPSLQERLAFAPGDLSLQVLRSSFVFAQWVFLLTLATGGTTELAPRFDPRAVAERLCRSRVDRIAVVPTMLRQVVAALRDDPILERRVRSFHRLGTVIAGGELLPVPLGESVRSSLPGVAISIIYGLTETSSPEFVLPAQQYEQWASTVGQALDCTAWRIVEGDLPVARGDVGELLISSPGILRGYLDDPEQTAAAFTEGFLRTGDLVREVADGHIEIVGRNKNIVIRGGNKISPLEVERALEQHPLVAAAFVCGVPDPVKGERLVAAWMSHSGSDVAASTLAAWLGTRLEPYKIPDTLFPLDDLRLGATGKADRVAIERYMREVASRSEPERHPANGESR